MGGHHARHACRPGQAPALIRFLDTNVVIRHLTGDPPKMARRATAALTSGNSLLLTEVIVAECVYVLQSFYEVDRRRIAEMMRSALSLRSVEAYEEPILLRALEVYELDKLDFAEAYLVAHAEVTGVGEILSFDRGIDRMDTVTRSEP